MRCASVAWRARLLLSGALLSGALLSGLLHSGTARAQEPGPIAALGADIALRARALDGEPSSWCVRVTTTLEASESNDATRALPSTLGRAIVRHLDDAHLVAFHDTRPPASTAHRLGYARLLDIEVRRHGTQFRVDGVLLRAPSGESVGRIRLDRPLTVALRSRLGWLPPRLHAESVQVHRGPLGGRRYLAMAIVDVDQDGRGELVTVSRRGVRVFSVEAFRGRLGPRLRTRLRGAALWPEDLPPAPRRRRRTVATAVGDGHAVRVRTSEHAWPLRVVYEDGVLHMARDTTCEGFPIDAGCAQLVEGRDFFDETLIAEGPQPDRPQPDRPQPDRPQPHVATGHFYALRHARFVDRDGDARRVEARVTTGGRLALQVEDETAEAPPRRHAAMGYGVALAMSDLDLDGHPELLASHASAPDAPDQLSLLRARGGQHFRVVWRSEPTAGPVWAAASGDVDGDGLEELLAIEAPGSEGGRSRLWMVR